MKPAATTGAFISFEGVDGAGKSTQIGRVADALAALGRTVVVTREPGGAPGAEAIRDLLLQGALDRWTPMTEALLVYAARADHLARKIRPALSAGAIVLSDRFSDSTHAYQGAAGGLGAAVVDALDAIVVGEERPNLTIILDAPPGATMQRTGARTGAQDRIERKGADFQSVVREAFLAIAERDPARCVVIDATAPVEVVTATILGALRSRRPDLFVPKVAP